jgi:glycine cleavage system H protein
MGAAEADGSVTVGITQHAQDLLGDMVFVENPVVGRQLAAGEECAVVESVKAASDVYAPIAGEVLASQRRCRSQPGKHQQDAYAAWMFTLKPANAGDLGASDGRCRPTRRMSNRKLIEM